MSPGKWKPAEGTSVPAAGQLNGGGSKVGPLTLRGAPGGAKECVLFHL